MARTESNQLLSAQGYALISLAGLIIGISLLFFYVYEVPKLVESGVQNQIFYLLLIPWAISCAAFLFGAMRSYARFNHSDLGGTLELGGPVVLFCAVLWGGVKLIPPPAEPFNLTVRAHSADGTVPLVTAGKITLELDDALRSEDLAQNGEANFKGIPPRFKGMTVRVLAQVDGYKKEWQRHKLVRDVLDLPLERVRQSMTHLTGSLVPPPKNGSKVRVRVDGQSDEGTVDELGRFDFSVKGTEGDTIRLKIYADGELVYDDYQTLPGPVTLNLRKGKR